MNPLCPNCQTELTDDFGLVDCKSCGAVCSIDLDDNVTVQGDEPVVTAAPEPEDHIENEPSDAAEEDSVEPEGLSEYETEEWSASEEEPYEAVEESTDLEGDSTDSAVYEEVDAEADQPAAFSAALSGEDFLKDLEIFSGDVTHDGGHVYYDFHVAGLEDVELREVFVETLADARLEIAEDYIREQINEDGGFTLMQVSFLRLTVIYKRLMSLGLDMSWSKSEVQEPASYLPEDYAETDEYGEYEADESGDEDEVVYEEEY